MKLTLAFLFLFSVSSFAKSALDFKLALHSGKKLITSGRIINPVEQKATLESINDEKTERTAIDFIAFNTKEKNKVLVKFTLKYTKNKKEIVIENEVTLEEGKLKKLPLEDISDNMKNLKLSLFVKRT